MNQEVALRMLESLGCQVDIVGDGQAAVEAVRQQHYDLVFLDCQMPTVDGYQAARQIRILERGVAQHTADGNDGRFWSGRLPVVALTAHSMPADRARCLANGMDDYVSKPFSRSDLEIVLERWLSGRASERLLVGSGDKSDKGGKDEDASQRPAPPSDPVIDEAALEEVLELDRMSGGGVFDKVIRIYLGEAPVILQDLGVGVRDREAERIFKAAHSLKSASLNVGAARLAALCRGLEALGRSGTTDGAEALLSEIDQAYAAAKDALEARLETYGTGDRASVSTS